MEIEVAQSLRTLAERRAELRAIDKKLEESRALLDKKILDELKKRDMSDMDALMTRVMKLPVCDREKIGFIPCIVISDGNLSKSQRVLVKYTDSWTADIVVMWPENFRFTEEDIQTFKKYMVSYAYHGTH